MIRVLILCMTMMMLISCKKEDPAPEIPVVPVNFVIDPNSTQYINLNLPEDGNT